MNDEDFNTDKMYKQAIKTMWRGLAFILIIGITAVLIALIATK